MHFVGVDVGTGSVRAGVVDEHGRILSTAVEPIRTWSPRLDHYEQSAEQIWQATCRAVRRCVLSGRAELGEDAAAAIGGIGFDATCSLVVVSKDKERPLSVTLPLNDSSRSSATDTEVVRDVILWMDHRAVEQAKRINEIGLSKSLLKNPLSPEMEPPKLLWLKEHIEETWNEAVHFMDLADYLTYRASGDSTRSLCTTVCKWQYQYHCPQNEESEQETKIIRTLEPVGSWNDEFWKAIGLEDLIQRRNERIKYSRIGINVRPPGEALSLGLNEETALAMGLKVGTKVAVSIIDAHAGAIGLLAGDRILTEVTDSSSSSSSSEKFHINFNERLALISGTSACHMALTPILPTSPVGGIWGPYLSVVLPGYWLSEGGQTASGSLLDHVLKNFYPSTEAELEEGKQHILLHECLEEMARREGLASVAMLTRDVHVLPDFHGNRSPIGDPALRGVITGLSLASNKEEQAKLYLATVQALAYGTRHIIQVMNKRLGFRIASIFLTGGGASNQLLVQQYADITGCPVFLPAETQTVLLGTAMLAAVASGRYSTIMEAMQAMSRSKAIVYPTVDAQVRSYHQAKYNVYRQMQKHQLGYRRIMAMPGNSVSSQQ